MEMREPDVRDIEGLTYEVRALPTTQGLRLMTRLAKVLGDGVGAIVEGGPAIGRAIPALLERIPDDLLTETCVLLGARTTVVMSPQSKPTLSGEFFEQHFAGRYHLLVQWLQFALEVNFGPLAEWLQRAADKAAAAATKA